MGTFTDAVIREACAYEPEVREYNISHIFTMPKIRISLNPYLYTLMQYLIYPLL